MKHERIYTGPMMNHPEAKSVGFWTGLLHKQSSAFAHYVRNLRSGVRIGPGIYLNPIVTLTMIDGTVIRGSSSPTMASVSMPEATVRLFLSQWNGSRFEFAQIDISGETVNVRVFRTPKQPDQSNRRPSPMIFHPRLRDNWRSVVNTIVWYAKNRDQFRRDFSISTSDP